MDSWLLERGPSLARFGACSRRGERPTASLRAALGRRSACHLAGGRRAGQRRGGGDARPCRGDGSRAGGRGLHMAGMVADDPDEEVRLHTEEAGLAREQGDRGFAHCREQPRHDRAALAGTTSARSSSSRKPGCQPGAGQIATSSLALVEYRHHDADARRRSSAHVSCCAMVSAARELGQVEVFMDGFAALGAAYAREDPARAARLLGRADALREETASDVEPLEARVRDEAKAALRASLGEDAYAAALRRGTRTHARGRAHARPRPD